MELSDDGNFQVMVVEGRKLILEMKEREKEKHRLRIKW